MLADPFYCSKKWYNVGATNGKTAEEAVNNLLYNMPSDDSTVDRHIITVFVDNEAGVLSKISGLLSSRGFNIDSLTVGTTNVKGLSRMTIVLKGQVLQLQQCEKQLEDVVRWEREGGAWDSSKTSCLYFVEDEKWFA